MFVGFLEGGKFHSCFIWAGFLAPFSNRSLLIKKQYELYKGYTSVPLGNKRERERKLKTQQPPSQKINQTSRSASNVQLCLRLEITKKRSHSTH